MFRHFQVTIGPVFDYFPYDYEKPLIDKIIKFYVWGQKRVEVI